MGFQPKDDAHLLSQFRQQVNEISDYFSRMNARYCVRHEFTPLLDVYETGDVYVIEIDLPGFSEHDFTVTATGSTLRIEGVKFEEKPATAVNYICLERHFGRFSLTLDIPAAFDPATAQALYQRGVLTLRAGRKNDCRTDDRMMSKPPRSRNSRDSGSGPAQQALRQGSGMRRKLNGHDHGSDPGE